LVLTAWLCVATSTFHVCGINLIIADVNNNVPILGLKYGIRCRDFSSSYYGGTYQLHVFSIFPILELVVYPVDVLSTGIKGRT